MTLGRKYQKFHFGGPRKVTVSSLAENPTSTQSSLLHSSSLPPSFRHVQLLGGTASHEEYQCNEQSFENVVFGFPDTKQIPKSVNGCHLHYTAQGVTGITKQPSISLLPSCVTGSSRHLRLSCFTLIPYHQCLDQFSSLCQILPLSWATQLWLTHPTTYLLRTALFSCLMTSSTPP